MSAWHKALKNVRKESCMWFEVDCEGYDEEAVKAREHRTCHRNFAGDQFFPNEPGFTKFDEISGLRSVGWTWDSDGKWLCPYCSKEGE